MIDKTTHKDMRYDQRILIIVFFLLSLMMTVDIQAGQLSDVSFSGSGDKILSRYRNKISVWETVTGKLLRTFETETEAFKFAAFLPDGKTIFSVNAKAEMIWLDIESGQSKNKIQGKAVYPYAISTDGETIVHSASSPNGENIEFYDTRQGNLKKSFHYPSNSFVCLSFFHDGKKLLAIGEKISVISVKTGKIEKNFDLHLPILSCAVSPRGDSILGGVPVITADEGPQIYSLQKKQRYLGLNEEYQGLIGDISAVGYSPANPYLAFAAGRNRQAERESAKGLLIVWDTKTGNIKQNLKTANPLASAAFSADGKNILVQEINGNLILFDAERGTILRRYADKVDLTFKRLLTKHTFNVQNVKFLPERENRS